MLAALGEIGVIIGHKLAETMEKKGRSRRRRRLPAPRKTFQASFLYGEPRQTEDIRVQTPLSCDLEAFTQDTLTRLRYRSPPEPTDYRVRHYRAPQELKLNSRLVRDTLSHSASAMATRPGTKEGGRTGEGDLPKLYPLVAPQLLIAGLSAPVNTGIPARPPSSASSQMYFKYDRSKKPSLMEAQRTDRLPVKYFNAEIIPKKPERTVTMTDIQKYLSYLGTKPFR